MSFDDAVLHSLSSPSWENPKTIIAGGSDSSVVPVQPLTAIAIRRIIAIHIPVLFINPSAWMATKREHCKNKLRKPPLGAAAIL